MSILKQAISEIAAGGSTGAGGIAGAYGSLFGGGVVDLDGVKRRQRKMLRRIGYIPVKEQQEETFNSTDVFSKVDAAAKKAKSNEHTIGFALEDADGNLVRVYVPREQAEEFELALGMQLEQQRRDRNFTDYSNEEDSDKMYPKEIAEVLYELKTRFTIVGVEWPKIETDPEEEQEVGVSGSETAETGDGEETLDDEGAENADGDEDLEAEMTAGDEAGEDVGEEDAKTALQSVIDMMKADAEAKKAEAEADKAKAEAETASYAARAAEAKVKAEEETLDMETYYNNEKKKDDEAKQIQKLAKYRHEVDGDEPDTTTTVVRRTEDVGIEEEEDVDCDNPSAAAQEADRERLLDFLLKASKAQH